MNLRESAFWMMGWVDVDLACSLRQRCVISEGGGVKSNG